MLYEQLFRSIPLPVAVVDAELVVHDANEAFCALVGTRRSDAIGAPLGVAVPQGAAVAGGQFDVEACGRPARLRLLPLPECEPARAVAVLAEPADDRFVELCAAIRTIKHEINNPLTGALGNITLLLRRPDLDEKTRKRLTTAEQELKKISQIVVRLAELAPALQAQNRPR